jgi:uridine kinase
MNYFDLRTVSEAILDLARRQQVVLVAIDGPGGAGKTTLARELTAATGAALIQGDYFYRVMDEQVRASLSPGQGYWQYFDWERLRDQVLRPLRAGADADYQLYDWERNALGQWTHVDARGVVIIEGVYTCRSEFRPFYDLMIYVETPSDVCLARLHRRGENPDAWIERWAAANDWYFQNVLTTVRFNFVINGGGPPGGDATRPEEPRSSRRP